MKSKCIVNYLLGSWIIFIALDGISGLFRSWYTKKMKIPFRFLYTITFFVRSVAVFLLFVLNYLMIAERNKLK